MAFQPAASWEGVAAAPRDSQARAGEAGSSAKGLAGLPVMDAHLFLTAGRCAELQIHVTEAMATATEQKELIARLEQDLSTIQSMRRPDAEASPAPSPPPQSTTPRAAPPPETPAQEGGHCSVCRR